MIGVLVGSACGTAVGIIGTLLVLRWRRRAHHVVPIPLETVVLLDEHTAARRAQVAAFAEGLADGDAELRARLQTFERGAQS